MKIWLLVNVKVLYKILTIACDYRCDICEYDGINETGNCLICRRGFDVTKKCATCTNSY